jgi:dienelactone hydrolase
MTLPDILPYYFAMEPAPNGDCCAFAVARPVPDGADVGVSIVIEDQNECTEIFRFSRLDSVRIAWSRCGSRLAFSQNSTLLLYDEQATLRLSVLPENVQWLGFDAKRNLWCLAGRRLEIRQDNEIEAGVASVESVAISGHAVYCRREAEGLCLYLDRGGCSRKLACLSDVTVHETAQLSVRGHYLLVVLRSTPVDDRARVRMVRFDLTTRKMDPILDAHFAFGFNAGPAFDAVPLPSGEILAAYEDGGCTRVWSLTADGTRKPLSPDGFEVFDFVVHAGGDRLAIIASETRSATGACERQLLIGHRDGNAWRFSAPVSGIHDMPRWRHDGRLEILRGDDGRWVRSVHDPAEPRSAGKSGWCKCVSVSGDGMACDLVRLPEGRRRRAGIILLPRLHQQFVAGAQALFFHHLLFATARSLASDGYTVVALGGPGAIGRGRSRRESPGSAGEYVAQIRAAAYAVARSLQAEGCRSMGLLAGSMAAIAALRMIGCGTPFSACAFVSPLFEASIAVTAPVRRHFDEPSLGSLEEVARTAKVPLLVVHGARDEVVPLPQVTQVINVAKEAGGVELCLFQEEGHIFKRPESWQRTESAISNFFALYL